jgi:hypothetical protein
VTSSAEALRAALEAAGLSLQAMPEEQRAMFASLTEEEVTRLIGLRIGQPAAETEEPAADRTAGPSADGTADPEPAVGPRQDGHPSSDA